MPSQLPGGSIRSGDVDILPACVDLYLDIVKREEARLVVIEDRDRTSHDPMRGAMAGKVLIDGSRALVVASSR